jgi:hypothetical protein
VIGPSSAIASTTSPFRRGLDGTCAAVLERVLEQLREDERERGRAVAGARDGLERRVDLAARADALDEHRAQPLEQVGEVDVVVAPLRQHLVHGRDREDPADRVLERLARVDRAVGTRLEAQQRRDGLQVVLDAMVDLLGEHARITARPCSSATAACARSRRAAVVVLRERRRAVGDELADCRPPAQRLADRVRVRTPPATRSCRPRYERGPVAESASIVVFTIASSDSSR